MARSRLVVPAFLLAGVLAAAGCGSGNGATDTAAPPASATPTAAAPTASVSPSGSASAAAAVPERLAFTGTTVDGAEFRGASLAGKPAVLWFWAPWCPKCRTAGPEVAKAAGKHQGKVTVVGVAGLSKDTGSMRDFVAATKTGSMTHLADDSGDVWKRFGVTSQHTYVLIAADGTVTHKGALSGAELEARVTALAG